MSNQRERKADDITWARGDSVNVEAYVRPATNGKRIRELPKGAKDKDDK